MSRRTLFTFSLGLWCLATSQVNAVPPPAVGPTITNPAPLQTQGIRVVAETVALDCSGLPSEPCSLETSLTVRCGENPCRSELEISEKTELRAKGAGQLVTEGERPVLSLSAKGRMTLFARRTLSYAQLQTVDRLIVPAVKSRHLILSNYRFEGKLGAVFRFAAPGFRDDTYAVTLSVHFPKGWTVRPLRTDMPAENSGHKFKLVSSTPPGSLIITVDHAVYPGPWRGGVVLGLGAMLEREQFRFRAGYEFAMPKWLLYGFSIDTNFIDDVVLSPTIVASLPTLTLLPFSLSVGAGAAFRVTKGAEAGVRMTTTVQLLMIGFNATFDVYPGRSTNHLETTLSALIMF